MSKTSLGQVSWLRVFCYACLKSTGRLEALQTGAAGMGDGGWGMGGLWQLPFPSAFCRREQEQYRQAEAASGAL